MKNASKRIVTVLLVTIGLLAITVTANASSGYGYAIYRDGAFVGYTWHAGLLTTTFFSDSSTDHIYHIDDLLDGVALSSGDDFLKNNNFMGYYRPNQIITSAQKNNVVIKAYHLANCDIGYTPLRQLSYPDNTTGIVDPAEITRIRCDGVVEYCYEFYEIRIFGSDTTWNISVASVENREAHSGTTVTPKSQAILYMTNMLGDIDGDGRVSADDARKANRISAGLDEYNEFQRFVCDVDGNGSVSAEDARLILRYSSGLESTFPAQPTMND